LKKHFFCCWIILLNHMFVTHNRTDTVEIQLEE
jgi:hypothetical protein